MSSYYDDYFIQQIGGQYDNEFPGRIKKFYVGAPYQKGHGIGSFLGGLFRRVLPLFTRGTKVVGKELLRAGMNFVDDVTNKDIPPGDAFKSRLRESGENLKRKAEDKLNSLMSGSGYKYRKSAKMFQSGLVPVTGTIERRRVRKKSIKKKKKTKKRVVKKKPSKGKKSQKNKKKKKTRKQRSVRDIFG